MGGWVGGLPTLVTAVKHLWGAKRGALREIHSSNLEGHMWKCTCGGWVGGWVGWWLAYRKVEENEAIRMSYCKLGMGGWVDGSGGWVGGRDLP